MKKRIFTLFGILVLAALFNIDTAYASATRNLQPGRTYEFTGTDPRVISHVDVSEGRFEFVELNSQGELLRFGTSSRRFTISGTSTTKITPLEPLSASFNANRVALEIFQGSVLSRTMLTEGESATIRNTGLADVNIRIEGNGDFLYDFIVIDSFGEAARFDIHVRFPQISVPGRGFMQITAEEGEFVIYYPAFLDGDVLRTTMQVQPVMTLHELNIGREAAITNLSDEAISFTVRTQGINVMFRHTFVLRGRDGHVVNYGNRAQNNFAVPAGHTIYINPLIDAYLVSPRFFIGRLSIDYGHNVPVHRLLQSGDTITITNTGRFHTHRIFFTGGAARDVFSLDHVTSHAGSHTWGIQENVVGEWAHNLAPGASITVTITETAGYAAANIPNVGDLVVQSETDSAKIRYHLLPGESVYIVNSGGELISIQTISEYLRPRPDFVLYDTETGNIESFGRIGPSGSIDLDRNESILITSADYPITVLMPRVLTENGISIAKDSRQAIVRHSLVYGETMQIDNLNRLYNRFLLVEDETPERVTRRGFRYDFTLTQITAAAPTFLDFGMNNLGLHLLPPRRRLNIMPNEDSVLTVAFPAEWSEHFNIRNAPGEPLFMVTITPGRRLQVYNRSRTSFVLANDGTGFLVQRLGEFVRIYEQVHINPGETIEARDLFPPGWSVVLDAQFDGLITRLPPVLARPIFETAYRYEFVPAPEVNIHRDAPQVGGIFIAAGERATIIAPLGEDLTIWMPRSWAISLGLLR